MDQTFYLLRAGQSLAATLGDAADPAVTAVVSYQDTRDIPAAAMDRTAGADLAGTDAVTLLGEPEDINVYRITDITLHNADNAQHVVTLSLVDGDITLALWTITLAAGATWTLRADVGRIVIGDAQGMVLQMGEAVTTTAPTYVVQYDNITKVPTSVLDTADAGTIGDADELEIVAGDGTLDRIVVRNLTIHNADSVQHVITVSLADGDDRRGLFVLTLAAGATWDLLRNAATFSESSGSGATAFTELTDAPASYTNQAGKMVIVNKDEDGVEFAAVPSAGDPGADGVGFAVPAAWQTGTAYTITPTISVVTHGGSSYACTSAHTSGASTEPGVGASWQTKWALMAAKGDAGADGADGADGATGATGSTGATGAAGAAGADGKTILNGSGAPGAGLGVNGDFYLDTAANAIYGPKTGGAWGSGTSLIGPAGADANPAKQLVFTMFGPAEAVTTGDGKAALLITPALNGKNITAVYLALHGDLSTSGTPTAQLRRKRGETDVDVCSTRPVIAANKRYNGETGGTAAAINTSNDDLATGDVLYADCDVSGTGSQGMQLIAIAE